VSVIVIQRLTTQNAALLAPIVLRVTCCIEDNIKSDDRCLPAGYQDDCGLWIIMNYSLNDN